MSTQEINLQELEERFETTAAAIESTCDTGGPVPGNWPGEWTWG